MNEIELAPELRPIVDTTLAEEHVADIVEKLNEQDSATIAHALQQMPFDRAADVFQEFDEPVRHRLGARLDRQTSTDLKKLAAYPERSAGSIMTTEFVSVPSSWTVQETLDHKPVE